MIFQLQNLNKYSLSQLPPECRNCGWWQGYDRGWKPREAEAWSGTAEETFGSWGKMALGDGELLGMVQFGPPQLFPRCKKLPCGPVSKNALLLTCGAVGTNALESIRKSLVTSVLAELRQLRITTVEAFGVDGDTGSCHYFSADFLRDCGFYPVKNAKGIKIMRLEMGGIQPVESLKATRLGLLHRLKSRAAAPAPVALAERCGKTPPAKSLANLCR